MEWPIVKQSKLLKWEGSIVLDQIFRGLFETGTVSAIGLSDFLLCIGAALVIGALLALAYTYRNTYTKSFMATIAMLPAVVCVVIMMVSGNLGAGIAVAGTFSLVRFRSVPGTAKEICAIFLAMASGLATGMGYIGFAFLFSSIMALATILYTTSGFGEQKDAELRKTVRITIPEDLDYGGVFDDLFSEYTTEHTLRSVKTTNMGSMFKLTYNLSLKNGRIEKDFIDAVRCRNGNLEISSSTSSSVAGEL